MLPDCSVTHVPGLYRRPDVRVRCWRHVKPRHEERHGPYDVRLQRRTDAVVRTDGATESREVLLRLGTAFEGQRYHAGRQGADAR